MIVGTNPNGLPLLAETKITVISWLAVVVALANGRGSCNHYVGRSCTEIGDGVAVGPPINLDLELSGDATYIKRVLDIPGVDFVEVERTNSCSNGRGNQSTRGGVSAGRSFVARSEDACTRSEEVYARSVIGEGTSSIIGHGRII